LKDIIIIRGENYAPQDIEHVVEQSHPGIRKQSSVAAIVTVFVAPDILAVYHSCPGAGRGSANHSGLFPESGWISATPP